MTRKDFWIGLLSCMVVASCATFKSHIGPYRQAQALEVPDNGWLWLEGDQELPSCEWMLANGINGVESDDAMEADISELCDVE